MSTTANNLRIRMLPDGVAMAISLVLAWLLYAHGSRVLAASAIPLGCLLLLVFRRAFLLYAVTASVFYAFVFEELSLWKGLDGPALVLVVAGVVYLASTARVGCSMQADPWMRARTSRLHFSRPVSTARTRRATGPNHLWSLLWIVAACGASFWWSAPLQKELVAGPHIGILPQPFFGMQLVFFLAILVLFVRGVLSYLGLWLAPREMSQLVLQQELWKTLGAEQRRVARAEAKATRSRNPGAVKEPG